jgi:ABC-type bacteriocin/lantibiotic exporter with double-glycine peptidase domain
MSSKPPFIGQERSDMCMVACLRMLLAHGGDDVAEATLVEQIALSQGGIDPDQLAALARRHGLKAEPCQLDLEKMIELVQAELFPIVLIDRSLLDREFSIHAVIPFRFSRHFVNVLDPLRGERRISRRKFVQAHRRVGRWALVWER